jgi:type I restriction enzyme M protein
LWFLARNRQNGKFRNRSGEILFIDARNMGELINRRTRILTPGDIATISRTYHNWRNPDGKYEDVKGFCASVPLGRLKELDFVLTPGRYVGLPDEEDDFDFAERFAVLQKEFTEQLEEETRLNAAILEGLAKVKI